MQGTQLQIQFDYSPRLTPDIEPALPRPQVSVQEQPSAVGPETIASREKAKARDILAAIRTLKTIEQEQRKALARFGGFGPVTLSIFPHPVRGGYKDSGWWKLGQELEELLTSEEYDSAKRTTFNAFYTSSTVIRAMRHAIKRLGVPEDALVLEPGCGAGRFLFFADLALAIHRIKNFHAAQCEFVLPVKHNKTTQS